MTFTINKPVSLVQPRYENIPAVLKYAMFGTGPLTILGGVEGMAWVPTKYTNRTDDWYIKQKIKFKALAAHVLIDF